MAENNFTGVIESLMKGMNTVLSTKTVVGEPTKLPDDTVIVPLVDVSFGVGAGASVGDKKNGGMGGNFLVPGWMREGLSFTAGCVLPEPSSASACPRG